MPLLWLAVVVAGPIVEEALFRGFFFRGIQCSKLGAPGAIIITSVLWSALHLQYDTFEIATIFVFGLLLGCVRWQTGSLYLTIILHSLSNLVPTIALAEMK